MPLFITAIAAGEPVTIHGDGEQSRDFTYVDNVVDATIAAGERRRAQAAACSTSPAARLRASTASPTRSARSSSRPVEKVFGPSRPGDIRDSWADLTAAREVLGYEPAVSLEEGLRRTAAALVPG